MMKRPVVLAILLLLSGSAGCMGDDGGSTDPSEPTSSPASSESDANLTGTDQGHTHNATLEAPPEWDVGTHWTVEVQDSMSGETRTVTRVVADRTSSTYRVGMPVESFSHPVVLGHFPGMGDVRASDLSFSVHNERFQPLDFPLEQGKTWTTTLYQEDFEAEVVEASGGVARVEMTGSQNSTVEITYDASQKAITQYSGPLGLEMAVQQHGHGFEGTVKVAYDRAQFIDGRIAAAVDFMLQPAPPTGTVQVDSSYDEASFAQIVGSIPLGTPAQPGVYREVTTDPDGNSTEIMVGQTGGGLSIQYGSSASAAGEWSFEHVAGGFGVAATEIIAYQTQTVELGGPATTNATTHR